MDRRTFFKNMGAVTGGVLIAPSVTRAFVSTKEQEKETLIKSPDSTPTKHGLWGRKSSEQQWYLLSDDVMIENYAFTRGTLDATSWGEEFHHYYPGLPSMEMTIRFPYSEKIIDVSWFDYEFYIVFKLHQYQDFSGKGVYLFTELYVTDITYQYNLAYPVVLLNVTGKGELTKHGEY